MFGAIGIWLVVCVVVYFFQRRLQYFPDASRVPLPALPGLEEVTLTAADGVELKAWHWPGLRPLTLLIFHGNAGHRGHRLGWIEGFHRGGWGVFLLDYRGYGGSGGSPTEQGFYKDADAAYLWLKSRGQRVAVLGRSIGAGVALDLASREPVEAIILDSGAISMAAVASVAYKILPVRLLMTDQFDATEKLERIRAPLLAIHGEADGIIPMRLGRELYDAFPGKKTWLTLKDRGHNDARGAAYYRNVDDFLKAR